MMKKIKYLLWAMARTGAGDPACPYCQGKGARVLRQKYAVTQLRECRGCKLRFRTPLDDPQSASEFYQGEYQQGFTTDLPGEAELSRLIQTEFRNTEKDFSTYIRVLRAAGLGDGAGILDFGASWGYGSWQMRAAGYRVQSYEIGRDRAKYAAQRLGCEVRTSAEELRGPFDCVFSSHVLEHLSDPGEFWRIAARLLPAGGVVVAAMPNGDPATIGRLGESRYHRLWGKVHPLLLTAAALRRMAEDHGFQARTYSDPYPLGEIAEGGADGDVSGDELLVVARKL